MRMCVFESVCVFLNVEGCTYVDTKGINIWVNSNAHTRGRLCKSRCFVVVRVGTLFPLTENRMNGKRYVYCKRLQDFRP